jgi:hypothetical protein
MKISFGSLSIEFKTLAEMIAEAPNTAAKEFGKAAGDKVGDHVGAKLAENIPAASNLESTVDHVTRTVSSQVEKAARHPLNPASYFVNRFFPKKAQLPAPAP